MSQSCVELEDKISEACYESECSQGASESVHSIPHTVRMGMRNISQVVCVCVYVCDLADLCNSLEVLLDAGHSNLLVLDLLVQFPLLLRHSLPLLSSTILQLLLNGLTRLLLHTTNITST